MADLIDRQETLNALCDNCDTVQAVCPHYPCKRYTSVEALPSAQPDVPDTNVGDMISRQAAIMAVLYGSLGATTIYGRTEQGMTAQKETVQAIRMLPSAERHGKWIHDGYDFPHGVDWMHCSECGKRDVYCPATRTNFCPNCGARMDGE